jgi:hypothetical protein
MEETINDRIDDDRIGMIKMSSSTIEFMMITKTQCWETSMSIADFVDAIQDNYGVPVKDAVATLKDMVKYKGFVVEDNVMTLYLKHRNNVEVKFPPFGEPCKSPSFMWSAVTKDATANAETRERERAEEERIRIEEERIAAILARQQLIEQYKRWKKKNPLALVDSIPEQFAPLFTICV